MLIWKKTAVEDKEIIEPRVDLEKLVNIIEEFKQSSIIHLPKERIENP